MLKWGLVFSGENLTLRDCLAYARRAADAGADSLWTTELGRDAFTPLAAMASAVPGIRLGTAVATFARPPMLTETAAQTMAELSGENFVLGLGTAPPAWNANWHGLEVTRPVSRMREYVECIRTMWKGSLSEPIDYAGEIIDVRGYHRFIPAPFPAVPIYLAAVQPGMLRLCGEIADGLIANTLNTPRYFRDIVRPNVQRGLARAGRDESGFEYTTLKICAVDNDAAAARRLARHAIAFYATLPYFDIVLDPPGFTSAKNDIRAAFARGDVEAMIERVSDDMVAALALAGTPGEVRDQARQFEGLVDTILLYSPSFAVLPEQTRSNHEAIIDALAQWTA